MMKKIVVMIALSTCLTIGLASMSSAGDRQEMREQAGVEAGDRQEVREEANVEAGDRQEMREEAGVEAGDRQEVRESFD